MRHRLQLLFLFCLFTVGISAQQKEVYHLSWQRDVPLGASAIGLTALGQVLRDRTPDITLADLRLPNIPRFDRFATRFSSNTARKASDYTLYAGAVMPFLLLAGQETRQDFGKIAVMYAEVAFINLGLTDIIKSTALRPRPYVFDENLAPETVLSNGDRAAFLSGHTSGTAAGSFFFARVFADYYPDSKLKPYVWGTAIAMPALAGWLRIRAGRHYPSDVIAGYALGAAVGYFIPVIHRKLRKKR